jgi:hypothetical protein
MALRLKAQDKATVLAYVRRAGSVLRQHSPVGELWIVRHDRVRFRQGN